MGHPPRLFLPNTSLHVIRRGINRGAIVDSDDDRIALLSALRRSSIANDVEVHSYALMTTHYHMIVTPRCEGALSAMLKEAHESYVRRFNRLHDRIGTLWTGRPTIIAINDDRQGLTCLRYVELNPCRAKMVREPGDYRWSSYRFHACGEESDWLVAHPLYLGLGSTPEARQEAYRFICSEALTAEQLFEQRHPATGMLPAARPRHLQTSTDVEAALA